MLAGVENVFTRILLDVFYFFLSLSSWEDLYCFDGFKH